MGGLICLFGFRWSEAFKDHGAGPQGADHLSVPEGADGAAAGARGVLRVAVAQLGVHRVSQDVPRGLQIEIEESANNFISSSPPRSKKDEQLLRAGKDEQKLIRTRDLSILGCVALAS